MSVQHKNASVPRTLHPGPDQPEMEVFHFMVSQVTYALTQNGQNLLPSLNELYK